MDIRRTFGERVGQKRRSLNLSQEEFAFQSGVHRTYISGVERGARNPSLTMIEKLACALGVTMGELLDGASTDGID